MSNEQQSFQPDRDSIPRPKQRHRRVSPIQFVLGTVLGVGLATAGGYTVHRTSSQSTTDIQSKRTGVTGCQIDVWHAQPPWQVALGRVFGDPRVAGIDIEVYRAAGQVVERLDSTDLRELSLGEPSLHAEGNALGLDIALVGGHAEVTVQSGRMSDFIGGDQRIQRFRVTGNCEPTQKIK